MAHEASTPFLAITPAPAASIRRKRVILLCCEDLRPVACSLEDALRDRGWDVTVEFGADARPWVQKTPPGTPSVRVLCVPGTVDRALAHELRAAFDPDPEADLQILGVDDSPGLVQQIERLAGVEPPPPQPSFHALPRVEHAPTSERRARRERSWLVGATATLGVFAIVLSGIAVAQVSARATRTAALPAAGITTSISAPVALTAELPPAPRFDEPVLSAVATPSFDDWSLDSIPEEEPVPMDEVEGDDDDLIIFDDSPRPSPRVTTVADVTAPPLVEPRPEPEPEPVLDDSAPALDDAVASVEPVQLPAGFLPVAGMTVAAPAPITTVDPFTSMPVAETTPLAIVTVDPFAASADAVAP